MSDSGALLGLCCSLHGLSSTELQSKVNTYVSSHYYQHNIYTLHITAVWVDQCRDCLHHPHQPPGLRLPVHTGRSIQGRLLSCNLHILGLFLFGLGFQYQASQVLKSFNFCLVNWVSVWFTAKLSCLSPSLYMTILFCFPRLLAPLYSQWRKYR